ncbi:Methyltransferase-like protein 21B [Dimargaris verticillata]|uniref:Methyltransferase-like protein 21B n=1 Tax=Dimargaris verticillata TaxID=2761393 RepID=A0A9W8B792_9FUNG|nr:Methyltransferase-like protein 21B [Dimargaris verticillata]
MRQQLDAEITLHQNTGRVVWDGAYILAQYLTHHIPLSGHRCLELGAGSGLVGLAAWLHGAKVTLTDLPEALPHLRCNVLPNIRRHCAPNDKANSHQLSQKDIAVRELVWDDPNRNDLGQRYDYIFGSEILYLPHLHHTLLQVLQVHAAPATRIYLAYKPRGFGEAQFFALAAKQGFMASPVPAEELDKEFQDGLYQIWCLWRSKSDTAA